jgi:hypothetical protein
MEWRANFQVSLKPSNQLLYANELTRELRSSQLSKKVADSTAHTILLVWSEHYLPTYYSSPDQFLSSLRR